MFSRGLASESGFILQTVLICALYTSIFERLNFSFSIYADISHMQDPTNNNHMRDLTILQSHSRSIYITVSCKIQLVPDSHM